MATIRCSDVTMQNCDYRAEESSGEQAKADIFRHIQDRHLSWLEQLDTNEREEMNRRMEQDLNSSEGFF